MILERSRRASRKSAILPIVFPSLNQRADGSKRDVTLKLIQTGVNGGGEQTLEEKTGGIFQRGLVVAEMNHFVYLVLLLVIGALIALPDCCGVGRRRESLYALSLSPTMMARGWRRSKRYFILLVDLQGKHFSNCAPLAE